MLLGLVQALGVGSVGVPRIATGLGGGVARHGEICGALIGAALALGLKYGRERGEDSAAKEDVYSRVDTLICKFEEKFGSIRCRELTGCDLLTSEGVQRFAEKKLHADFCTRLVAFAAREAFDLALE